MNEALFPPQKVSLNKGRTELEITWRNGASSCVSGDDLRRFCACSGCRKRQVLGLRLITESDNVERITLLGSNALQATFGDGHDRGIYPWPYLYAISQGQGQGYFDE